MLFLVRHGERADHGTPEEKSQIQLKCDPHLTDLGKVQAKKAGERIVNLLHEYQETSGKKSEELKYLIISSPFRRCIQTANHVSQALPKENIIGQKIYLNDYLCDYLGDFHPESVLKDLQVRNSIEEVQKHIEFDLQDGYPEIGNHAFNPVHPEGGETLRNRVFEGHIKTMKPYFINEINKEKDVVLILVSHGYVVECLLELYEGHNKVAGTNYTAVSQVEFDSESLKGKVLVDRCFKHLKDAEEEYHKTLEKS